MARSAGASKRSADRGLLLGGRARLGEAAESREDMGACGKELDLEPSEPLPAQRPAPAVDELQRAIELARARRRTGRVEPAAAGKVGAAEPQSELAGGDLRRVTVAEPATADERQRAGVRDRVSELRRRARGADDAVDLVEQPFGLIGVAGDRLGPRAGRQGVSANLRRGAPRVVERPDRLPGCGEHLVRTAQRPTVPVCAAQPGARRALAIRGEQLQRPCPRRIGLGWP